MKRAFRRVFLIIAVVLFTGIYILPPTSVLAMDTTSKEKKQNSWQPDALELIFQWLRTGFAIPGGSDRTTTITGGASGALGVGDMFDPNPVYVPGLEEYERGWEPPLPVLDELEKSLPIEDERIEFQ